MVSNPKAKHIFRERYASMMQRTEVTAEVKGCVSLDVDGLMTGMTGKR